MGFRVQGVLDLGFRLKVDPPPSSSDYIRDNGDYIKVL